MIFDSLIFKCVKELSIFNDNAEIEEILKLIENFGLIITEMMKLKLYLPYCTIVLSILR